MWRRGEAEGKGLWIRWGRERECGWGGGREGKGKEIRVRCEMGKKGKGNVDKV